MTEAYKGTRTGLVLRIERSSIHDGDGFRTVVFLKGCPLQCQWCSTPESQSPYIETTEAGLTYGRVMTVDAVMHEVEKDSVFYFASSGGMTLSGGEILAQPEFSLALLQAAKVHSLNTAVETSFYAPWDRIEPLLSYIDTAYVDLKCFSKQLHVQCCGVSNDRILENLLAANKAPKRFRLVIRIPIIPSINTADRELEHMGAFCSQLDRTAYVQLLPYHRLGTATYKKLGRPYFLEKISVPTEEEMERFRSIIRRYVPNVI